MICDYSSSLLGTFLHVFRELSAFDKKREEILSIKKSPILVQGLSHAFAILINDANCHPGVSTEIYIR